SDSLLVHEEGITALSYGDDRRFELSPEMAGLPAAGQVLKPSRQFHGVAQAADAAGRAWQLW
uniref:hypothetical protein n=1 Tax=Marinobacterium profundum TaxID=1714300 RepID=UPI001C1F6243